jgi:hypothetical protein
VGEGPNRWLRLRRPGGFSDADFQLFEVQARLLVAYATELLAEWTALGKGAPPAYEFFPAVLSDDRTVASLPIGGANSLGSRAEIENGASWMLWQFFSREFMVGVEEGLTESLGGSGATPTTTWRRPGGREFANLLPPR